MALRFVITGQGRSGSNMIWTALASHPDCKAVGEYFNPHTHPQSVGVDGRERADQFYQANDFNYRAVGFKIFATQAREKPQRSVWSYLEEQKVHVIHLSRRNEFLRILSQDVAFHSKRWMVTRDCEEGWTFPAELQINYPVDWWEAKFTNNIKAEKWLTEKFSDHPYLRLFYEDHLLNTARESLNTIQAFLGLQQMVLPIITVKQGTKPPWEYVSNYDKLWDHFQNTPFGAWFPTRT